MFFKKLNTRDFPMNIRTKHSDAIVNQLQGELFEGTGDLSASAEPVVFFGYKKDRFGIIGDMKLVYIDEDKVKWTIPEDGVLKKEAIELVGDGKKNDWKALPRMRVARRSTGNE
jgi:hypothetical protein